jgi:hypothetical protein
VEKLGKLLPASLFASSVMGGGFSFSLLEEAGSFGGASSFSS